MIIGQQKILQYFENATTAGSLAHAYCLVGRPQVGKRALARELAAKLLKTESAKLASHPDFYYLERQEDAKTGKLKKEIAVSQARELREHLQKKSWLGGYQVVVIDEAELLNEESSNALLKILEEPPDKSVVFLLTENDEALLPTIKSRAQIFYLSLIKEEELINGLVGLGFEEKAASEAAKYAVGCPGRAIEFLQNPEELKNYRQEVERWGKLIGQPFYSQLKIIEDLFGDKDDAIRGREKIQSVMDIWLGLWREALLNKSGVKNSKEIAKRIEEINFVKQKLSQNIHPRLLLEQAVMGM